MVFLAFCGLFHLALRVYEAVFKTVPDFPQGWLLALYLGLSLSCTLYRRRPLMHKVYTIREKDVKLEICIGDIFAKPGCTIIPTNTSFDIKANETLIAETSIQGKFQKRLQWEDDDLSTYLKNKLQHTAVTRERKSYVGGNTQIYPMGTAVQINIQPYSYIMLAMAELNENGAAHSSRRDIETALDSLWDFLHNAATFADEINIPVLGTRYGRSNLSISETTLLIASSFIRATLDRSFTKKLRIIIYQEDFYKYNVLFYEINNILRPMCSSPVLLTNLINTTSPEIQTRWP